ESASRNSVSWGMTRTSRWRVRGRGLRDRWPRSVSRDPANEPADPLVSPLPVTVLDHRRRIRVLPPSLTARPTVAAREERHQSVLACRMRRAYDVRRVRRRRYIEVDPAWWSDSPAAPAQMAPLVGALVADGWTTAQACRRVRLRRRL